jgi:hypothetical protein
MPARRRSFKECVAAKGAGAATVWLNEEATSSEHGYLGMGLLEDFADVCCPSPDALDQAVIDARRVAQEKKEVEETAWQQDLSKVIDGSFVESAGDEPPPASLPGLLQPPPPPPDWLLSSSSPSPMDGNEVGLPNKFCIFCGTKLPGTARFCSSCGERQIEPSPE